MGKLKHKPNILIPGHIFIKSKSCYQSIKQKPYCTKCVMDWKRAFSFVQIVYGNSISNELDASVLASMVDLWISSSASRRDFEIPRGTLIVNILIVLRFWYTSKLLSRILIAEVFDWMLNDGFTQLFTKFCCRLTGHLRFLYFTAGRITLRILAS